MAPFVELEWGAAAFAAMRRIKALFDPDGLLNPGVILNDDPQVHLKHLKPLPAADPLVDKCIECGFCEPMCPSHGLTLSPRQRIVGWREIARLDAEGSEPERDARAQGALRLPRHRHLRRLRPVRHGVPGRHRDRAADQGPARAPGRSAGEAGRRDGGAALRGGDDRRAPRAWAPPTCCTASSARRSMKDTLDGLRKAVGRTPAEMVAGAGPADPLRAPRRRR